MRWGWMSLIKDACKSGALVVLLLFLTASAETSHDIRGATSIRSISRFHQPSSIYQASAFLPLLHRRKRQDVLPSFSASSISDCDDIPILFETDRLLVVNKPSGIPHHDDNDQNNPGMVTRLRLSQQQRLYGVHRLDRVTSGILLLAKDAEMAAELSKAFREGAVSKYYVGVSGKKPSKKKQGLVQGYMERSRQKSWILTRGDPSKSTGSGAGPAGPSSRTTSMAKTRFFTAGTSPMNEEFGLKSNEHNLVVPKTLVLFHPYTGKTHQLRVAAKSVGLPLLGDDIYRDGTTTTSNTNTRIRTLLHATAIHVELQDGPLTIWSPPPFAHLLWQSENASLEPLLTTLMEKHCNVPPILEAMKQQSSQQAST